MKRKLRITPELIVQMFADGARHRGFRVRNGLLPDAKLVDAHVDPLRRLEGSPELVLVFESPGWDSGEPLSPKLELGPLTTLRECIADAEHALRRARQELEP